MSLGTPMILMGDEVRRTQLGNNNAYCHDNELSWFDWTLVTEHADLYRFVKLLCAQRRLRSMQHERERINLSDMLRDANKSWHGIKLNDPDWSDDSRSVALSGELCSEGIQFHLILNAYWEPLEFDLPTPPDGERWRRWIDTSLDSPHDIVPLETAPTISTNTYRVESRTVVMLFMPCQSAAGDRPS
jgi:isoamylase